MLRDNRKKNPRYRTEFAAPARFHRWNNFCGLTIERSLDLCELVEKRFDDSVMFASHCGCQRIGALEYDKGD